MSGPPPIEQVLGTVAWVTERFREFYRHHPPPMPPRFGRREFGFLPAPRPPDRTPFFRHMGMRGRDDLAHYLLERAPHHCYYSTAYYKDPNQSTMQAKTWLGADLIFDLDADHLPGAETLSFEEQLVAVKKQAQKLLHDFVLGDFGFAQEHVRVVFSGGRGFHIHVDDPRVLELDAAARRDIVDYVVARGVEPGQYFQERTVGMAEGPFKKKFTTLDLPRADAPGWEGRFARGMFTRLEHLAALPRQDAVRELTALQGIGDKKAIEIYERILHGGGAGLVGRNVADHARQYGQAGHVALQQLVTVEDLRVAGVNESKGESDEPVTADIKRLIRLPRSLHGKTGLRVTPVAIDELADFDPLTAGIAFGTDPVRVVVSKPESVRLGDETFTCEAGEQDLPECYAVFLILRRRALLPQQA